MRIFLVIILLVSYSTIAQLSESHRVLHYNLKEGLSFGVVNSIVQDNQGFMWFATDDGLNRFDGITFKIFKFDSENPFSIQGNYIQSIYKDTDGILWITSRKGLVRFDASHERFITSKLSKEEQSDNDISGIYEGKNGYLWLTSSTKGLFKYHKKTNAVVNYRQSSLQGLSSNTLLTTYEDSSGLLWVGTHSKGINVFSTKNNKLVLTQPIGAEKLSNNRINCIYEDHFHNIWLATSNGLYFYQRTENKLILIHPSATTQLKSRVFLSLLENKNQQLLVGIQDGGLYQIDIQSRYNDTPKVPFRAVKGNNGQSFTQRSVQALYADKDKNVWVGTYGEGVYMLDNSQERFFKFQQKIMDYNTESDVRYYGMTVDNTGLLWLGTDGDGIFQTTSNGEVKKHYKADGKKGSLTDNAILSAFKDSHNNLWFGSYSGGLFLYNRKNDSFINFKHNSNDKNSLGANDVRVIYEDNQQRIWIGTNGGGLSVFNPDKQNFTNYNTAAKNFPSSDVRAIEKDHNGHLWIGTYGAGLYLFNPQNGIYTAYNAQKGDIQDLSSGVVFALHFDSSNNKLWIGTQENGLILYDTQQKIAKKFSEKNGLANNTILAIQEDNGHQIWVSTNKGIAKVDLLTHKIYNFDHTDGLQSGQFNGGAAVYHRAGGFMCFGGTEGWNLFYPDQIKPLTYQPKVLITGVLLFGKSLMPDTESEKNTALPSQQIILQPNQSVFSIQYGAINYSYPDENQFAYKLEGLDKEWNFVNKQKSATYRYLEPGEYTFKVKAANKDHIWFDNYASIKVIVLPPWYKTWWAYLFYSALIGLLIFYYQLYKDRQNELKYQIQIAKIEAEKEKELNEKKISFFTHISHEFRTPLTLIINPIKELLYTDSQEKDISSLHIVYRNARRLLSLVDQLLLFRKADTERDSLKVARLNLKNLCEEVFLCFTHQAKEKQIQYDFICQQDHIEVYGDREKLEIALFNLISNALKFTPKEGKVALSITEIADSIIIKVEDSGAGIAPETGDKLFKMFYQVKNTQTKSAGGFGIGLYLAKTFINNHKGDITYHSTLGQGTIFTIRLLRGYEHLNPDTILNDDELNSVILEELADNHDLSIGQQAELSDNEDRELTEEIYAEIKTMVIIDDNPQIRQYLKQIFKPYFKLHESDNGTDGLKLVEELLPDIVISDVMMQGMSGIELCTLMKKNTSLNHIPVILLTASTLSEIKLKGIEVGADDYISKPFEKDILLARVTGILKSRNDLQKYFFNEITLQSNNLKISSEYKDFLHQCIAIVEKHLTDPDFGVGVLATEIGMSPSGLYNRIKSICGQSPNNFIRFIRLRKAAEMLISTDNTVSETAFQVGVNDPKYFREQFFKLFGMNPSAYIKKYRKTFHNNHQIDKDILGKKTS
jgi:signal transduction histidine kinase/ligand-binding sensor domain-containing protein/CheY-like chemotaxis protein/AraC-like DNA-binding protein